VLAPAALLSAFLLHLNRVVCNPVSGETLDDRLVAISELYEDLPVVLSHVDFRRSMAPTDAAG
jgi:hypothetical protein